MKRLAGSVTLALVALVLLVAPVSAGRQWCAKDPVVSLNGTAVQILVAVPEEYVPAVNGAIDVRVAAPSSVASDVVFLDAGFNGYSETVSFQSSGGAVAADGSFEAGIRARVPVNQQTLREFGLPNGAIPVQVTVITNGELTWQGDLPVVVDGETTVVDGSSNGTQVTVTVQGSN
jgi:hypothetical protein